jgi:hypothetical protein
LFEAIATAWPDQLKQANSASIASWSLEQLAIGIRTGVDPLRLEVALLARKRQVPAEALACIQLLCWLHFSQCNRTAFAMALQSLQQQAPDQRETRILTLVGYLWADDLNAINAVASQLWSEADQSVVLQLCRIAYQLKIGDSKHGVDNEYSFLVF